MNKIFKLFVLTIFASLLFFTSCNNDKNENKVTITVVDGTGSGSYNVGDVVTIKPSLNEKDTFISWMENDTVLSTQQEYTFVARTSRTITANIDKYVAPVIKYCDLLVGNGSGEGTYVQGSKVTVTADEKQNYIFDCWKINGVKVSTNSTYTFTIYKDTSIIATYSDITYYSQYVKTLYKEQNEDFVIANFTDIQLHDGETTTLALEVIDQVVTKTNPDLIVFLGDLLNDDPTYKSVNNYKTIFNKFDSYDIPWTFIFGNHDYETYTPNYTSMKTTTSDDMIEYALTCKNCIFVRGPQDITGKSNYIINIVEKGTNKLVESLIMLDSRTGGIDSTHTTFYKNAMGYIKSINKNVLPETIVYSHIANPAYGDAYTASMACEYADVVGCINRNPCDLATGDKNFFTTLKEYGSTKYCICGHDHENAYYTEYQGIKLIYTMKSSEGDHYTNLIQVGGSYFTIGANSSTFAYCKADVPINISSAYSIAPDTTIHWATSGAAISFDFTFTGTKTGTEIRFALFGTNTHNTSLSAKEKVGAWNRLTGYISINLSTMSANYGTVTKNGDTYHYELVLSDAPKNDGAEVSDGNETLRVIYFDRIGQPFIFENFDITYQTTE